MSFFFVRVQATELLFFFAPAPLLVLMTPSSSGLGCRVSAKTTTFRFFAEAMKEEQQLYPDL